ncbi:ATP phosphoribosyltransferase regulatory subunit [Ruminococcus sp. FC2018]|uniref:ATP phosphoribosyltransferase regulatory subunit n=1 Tax=Ruminococcus sp. FC2018 TaxID=1410617 RepID=UPI00048D4976|nr:ATP phosphoribosyltransferase regulatory subunit [Ruminococcus sp. FC2018]
MKKNDLITPEGTRDLLFDECIARREAEQKLNILFTRTGYSEVVTPGIEFYDLFTSSTRHFSQENMYKLVDSKGRIIVMRPDSTIPIARLAASRLKDTDFPLRLFYNQSVYENNALLKGRSDEVVQAGIELLGGENKKRADYEALSIAVEALSGFDSDNFRLEIGHIGYFKTLMDKLDVDSDVKEDIRTLISTKNYPVLNDLLDAIGDTKVVKALKQLPRLFGGVDVLDKAAALYTDDKISEILDNLREVFNRLSSLGYEGKISLDLGIVSHIDYYTGIVFRGYLSTIGEAVLKGGRYDNLVGEFGRECNAVGFGVNVDSAAKHMMICGKSKKAETSQVLVFGKAGHEVDAMRYVLDLLKKGIQAENSLFDSSEESEDYARRKGIKKLAVIGDEITVISLLE